MFLEGIWALVIVAAWGVLAWKTVWMIRIALDVIHYLRTRELLAQLRSSLVYFGFIEPPEDDKYR